MTSHDDDGDGVPGRPLKSKFTMTEMKKIARVSPFVCARVFAGSGKENDDDDDKRERRLLLTDRCCNRRRR